MFLSPTEHHNPEMWHPRVRVEVLIAMLEEHRALDTPRSVHWYQREAEFLRRLARAQVELDRSEDGPVCA
jgi:hypothetical protein